MRRFLPVSALLVFTFWLALPAKAQTPPAQTFAVDAPASPLRAPSPDLFDAGSAFTMEAWIFTTYVQPRAWIMGKATPINGGAGGQVLNFGLQLDDAGTGVRFTTNFFGLFAPDSVPLRTWTHVAVTLEGGTTRLLVNGVVVATRENSPAIPAAPATPLGIGSTFDESGVAANGEAGQLYLRQLRFWSVGRSPEQVATSLGVILPADRIGLVGSWPGDESSGRVVRDLSGGGRHLTKVIAEGAMRLNVLVSGPFFTPSKLSLGSALLPDISACEVIDFDHDGDRDLILMQVARPTYPATWRRVLALRNDHGTFVDATDAVLGNVTMVNPRATWVADFNRDGRQDLLIAETGTDTFPFPGGQSRLFIQSADGRLVDETATRLPTRTSYTHDVGAADIDGDGDLDIVMVNYIFDAPRIYVNDGAGFFSDPGDRLPANVASGATENPSGSFVDVNLDGFPDLMLGGNYYALNGPNSTRPNLLLKNDGTGRFVYDPAFTLPPKLHGIEGVTPEIVSADFNGDGAPDLLVSTDLGAVTPGLQLLLNDGAGGLRDASAQLNLQFVDTDQWVTEIKVVDINQDGFLDLVLRVNTRNYSPINHSRAILLNRGNAVFVDATEALVVNRNSGVSVDDFDGDGLADLVVPFASDITTYRATRALALAHFAEVPPTMTHQPTGQTVDSGSRVHLTAVATGAPSPALQWQRNGVDVPGATEAVLVIPAAAWSDAGNYTLVATNVAGNTTSTPVALTVNSPPVIITPPTAQSTIVGGSVTFSVVASDTPTPGFQWRRNGEPVPAANGASLTLTDVQLAAAGAYDVVITNDLGTLTSTPVQLTVTLPSPLALWRAARFSTAELDDPQIGGLHADADGDGVVNLLEYALGREPRTSEGSASLAVSATDLHWVVVYTRPAARSDLAYAVEHSANLASWTTDGVTHERIAEGETETWRVTRLRQGDQPAFFRLRVTVVD